ncbi:hypothetical protein MMH89_03390 [Candidatus Comchoanobacter bicostacola]|uniref:Uncharacterized protein n=1 Tax=Candidatus Comchoanobacter bicostacola TaxID=2919598 RepID=A0ABY5DKE4_9GAMM|nr:hypothetical protein [Candidatus Comchoanobacter bicostacola]UTC24267.1 hypothetical protein MMH89_03390 [Candidatus Comchoanobacter bicostacola]
MSDSELIGFINTLEPGEVMTLHTINHAMLIYATHFEGEKIFNFYDPNCSLIIHQLDPSSIQKQICRYNTDYQFLSAQMNNQNIYHAEIIEYDRAPESTSLKAYPLVEQSSIIPILTAAHNCSTVHKIKTGG